MTPPTNMPPVPRDAQTATFSEIMPIRSKKISMMKSPVLWVTACAGLISIMGFGLNMSFITEGDPQKQLAAFQTIARVSTFALMLAITSGFYFYAKPAKPYWFYLLVAASAPALIISPVFHLLWVVTHTVIPGNYDEHPNLVTAICGPGLREELLKAIPALLGALLSYRAMANPALLQKGWVRNLRTTGPLDGVMMGIFAGAGFTFLETGFQYVTDQVTDVVKAGGSVQLGEASGMALLVPRVVEGLTGHSGYSAIFGYFIGLSVIRPRSKWMLLGIGYGIAVLLHGLWDGIPPRVPTMIVWSTLTGLMAIGVLLKARQLETVMTGRAAETSGSILVERPIPAGYPPAMAGMALPMQSGLVPPRPMAPPPPPYGVPPAGAPMAGPAVAPFVPPPYTPPVPPRYAPPPYVPPAGAPPCAPPSGAPAAPPFAAPPLPGGPAGASPAAAVPLVIDVDGLKLPVRGDVALDLGAEPALGARGQGVRGQIVPHPSRPGVFGLKNTGAAPWTAHLRDGTIQAIAGDKNIRLAPGVRIDFGGGLTGAVMPAG